MSVEDKLKEMGLQLDLDREVKAPVINKATRSGNLIFVSGHGPLGPDGKMAFSGRVSAELSLEEGYQAARLCALDCLSSVKAMVGSLDEIEEIVSVRGYVSSSLDFFDQPKVLNGASEFLIALLGDRGRHTRTAIGTSALPGNIPVEVDMIVRVGSA